VVASLWEVDDRSTTTLMKRFYGYLRDTDKARSLARAQRDMIETARDGPNTLGHPFQWAGFVLIGDAR
jgi:CHAT domain-containing protein